MSNWISPTSYTAFESEEASMAWCREWGLLTDKAAKQKTYKYRNKTMDVDCEVVGFADGFTAVIKIHDHLHCIHPSYLKELQAAKFGKSEITDNQEQADQITPQVSALPTTTATDGATVAATVAVAATSAVAANIQDPSEILKKSTKKSALTLPDGKVKFAATLQSFATVPNHFSDEDDEVLVFEHVSFQTDAETTDLESAWSSYSNTLKKLDLQIGDSLHFEAKIVAKKLTKHPVKYKLNNVAKVEKQV